MLYSPNIAQQNTDNVMPYDCDNIYYYDTTEKCVPGLGKQHKNAKWMQKEWGVATLSGSEHPEGEADNQITLKTEGLMKKV